jgi:beta-N-acetylhexosaminidase
MRRVLLTLLAALALAGCGGSDPAPAPTTAATPPRATPGPSGDVSIQDIERQNRKQAREHARLHPTPTATPTSPAATVEPVAISRPPMTPAFIPFPAQRKQEMAAYAQRHYGEDTYRLTDPKVIVEHFTATTTAEAALNVFRTDVADSELHELPATCAHYIIDADGTILEVVPIDIMCRHTVGLNDVSIGIEHVGTSDAQVLGNAAQMKSSLALTRWLQCRFGISTQNVIGHNESLTSPFHHENVAALRTQTHEDFNKADMDVYRKRLGNACA